MKKIAGMIAAIIMVISMAGAAGATVPAGMTISWSANYSPIHIEGIPVIGDDGALYLDAYIQFKTDLLQRHGQGHVTFMEGVELFIVLELAYYRPDGPSTKLTTDYILYLTDKGWVYFPRSIAERESKGVYGGAAQKAYLPVPFAPYGLTPGSIQGLEFPIKILLLPKEIVDKMPGDELVSPPATYMYYLMFVAEPADNSKGIPNDGINTTELLNLYYSECSQYYDNEGQLVISCPNSGPQGVVTGFTVKHGPAGTSVNPAFMRIDDDTCCTYIK